MIDHIEMSVYGEREREREIFIEEDESLDFDNG